MKRRRINTRKWYRALYSDTLPYELPVIFTNAGLIEFLYRFDVVCKDDGLKTKRCVPQWVNDILYVLGGFGQNDRRSYTYEILKCSYEEKASTTNGEEWKEKKRLLTIPHPYMQIQICELYKRYSDFILYQCSKSRMSVRYPYKIASYMSATKHGIPDGLEIEEDDKDSKEPKMFFAYKRYQNINGFFNDYVYQRAEKKYSYMVRTDLKHCFDNIRPEDLSLAIYGRRQDDDGFATMFAKLQKDIFAGTLDNKQATAGIAIGPEFSRIFAEIIQQAIDMQLQRKLEIEYEVKRGKDYDFYRYVDDGFFFCNDRNIKGKFPIIYNDVLEEWGLETNADKRKDFDKRPFVENQTIVKRKLNLMVEDFTKSRLDTQKGFERRLSGIFDIPYKMEANYVIRDLQSLIIEYDDINYKDITANLLTTIRKKMFDVYKEYMKISKSYVSAKIKGDIDEQGERILNSYEESFARYCGELTSLLAYIYTCDSRMSTSIKVEQLLVEMLLFIKGGTYIGGVKNPFSTASRNLLFKKVNDELRTIIKNSQHKGIELLNLMLTYHKLPQAFRPTANLIDKEFLDDTGNLTDGMDFLAVVTLEHLVGRYYREGKTQKAIEKWIVERLKDQSISSTERTILSMSALTCPYIDVVCKQQIGEALDIKDIDDVITNAIQQNIFVEWSNKKMLTLNYGKTSSQVY